MKESKVEQENYDSMMENHQALIDSTNYLAGFLSDLHYSDLHSINNCTKLVNDPCYKDVRIEGYFSACGPAECFETEFCKCIHTFRTEFENMVGINS